MNMSVFEIIKLGKKYMTLMPNRAELAQYFSDYSVIHISRFVCRYFPALAVIIFVSQIALGSLSVLPQAVVYALFILSMPVQALVILGVKADKVLPPSLSTWYKEGVAKINQQGGNIKLLMAKPRYIDLAYLLNLSYNQSFKS
jgi:hypothetical protein